jgi:hypothetical protein
MAGVTGIDPMKHPCLCQGVNCQVRVPCSNRFSFVHEIKPAITTEERSMTDTKHPHRKHAREKHRQLGVDLEIVVMKDFGLNRS